MPRFITSINSQQIQDDIEPRLQDSIDRVVLDFSNVASISSVAIGLIMRLRNVTSEANNSLHLINISDRCLEQLETVNLDKVLSVLD